MKTTSLILILIISISIEEKKNVATCQLGTITYVSANYDGELKKKYKKRLKHLNQTFKKCICETPPLNFPEGNRNAKLKVEQEVVIEPLIINTSNCEGLYGKRIYGSISARYVKGYPHYLFLISGGKYIEFESDSTLNNQLFEREKETLSESFTDEERENMRQILKSNVIWNSWVIHPPILIRNKEEIKFKLE